VTTFTEFNTKISQSSELAIFNFPNEVINDLWTVILDSRHGQLKRRAHPDFKDELE